MINIGIVVDLNRVKMMPISIKKISHLVENRYWNAKIEENEKPIDNDSFMEIDQNWKCTKLK